MKTALVLGAGGFVGSHLVRRLKLEGYWVRGVDLKYPEFSESEADQFLIYDLRDPRNVEAVMRLEYKKAFDSTDVMLPFQYLRPSFSNQIAFDEVYQLAADMGGAGYIFTGEHDAEIMNNSALINLNVAAWANIYGVKKLFYSSSACMYPNELQNENGAGEYSDFRSKFYTHSLKESDAYKGPPDSEYGWEKLFSERLYLAYARNYGLNIRIARFHNIYGPEGTYQGGREKAPAAMCRKVVDMSNYIKNLGKYENEKAQNFNIEVWGTGQQTRSFLYIYDCIDAVRLLMESDLKEPINIGSEEIVTINELAQMAIDISGKDIKIKNVNSNAVGVMGRNSDNTLIRDKLNWEPKFSLRQGLELTYNWIKSRYDKLD
jgi:nucleoside-diphosphate-sugar epimerase